MIRANNKVVRDDDDDSSSDGDMVDMELEKTNAFLVAVGEINCTVKDAPEVVFGKCVCVYV